MSASHKEELAHRLVVITGDTHTYEAPKSHFTYFETNNADAECVFTLVQWFVFVEEFPEAYIFHTGCPNVDKSVLTS